MSRGPVFRVALRLLPTAEGGRQGPIARDYRPNWNLGHLWDGEPTVHSGRVFLDEHAWLHPGEEGVATVEPLAPEFWGGAVPGATFPVQEGSRVIGHARVLALVSSPDGWSPTTAAFALEARRYLDWIARAPSRSLADRLTGARARLLALYQAACALPVVTPSDDELDTGPDPVAPAGWRDLDRYDGYHEVFDPYVASEPVMGSLSDDLLDVHADVTRGLHLWERGAYADAVWHWRLLFETHWGDHAIDALRALHRACVSAGRTM